VTALIVLDGTGATKTINVGSDPATDNLNNTSSLGFAITNPTSTLTLPATTTAYSPLTQIGSPGSLFTIPNTAGGFILRGNTLTTDDPAWTGGIVQIDFWRAAPTMTNADRGAYKIATGSANFIDSWVFTLIGAGDGCYASGAPKTNGPPAIRLASGTSIFWTAQSINGTAGVTVASGVFTLTAELNN
jgi:hypothetical protein